MNKKKPEYQPAPPAAGGCCGVGFSIEYLYVVPGVGGVVKTRFAQVPMCCGCCRVAGEVQTLWTEDRAVKAVQKLFSGTSWAMMLDQLKKRPSAPLNFEARAGGILVPENYQGELRAQTDLPNIGS